MTWTPEQWDVFAGLLAEGWPGKFDQSAQDSWRLLFATTEPARAIEGLRRLLHEGHTFRPSASEVLAAARRDPSRPTFAEALRIIDHCLRARAPHGARYSSEGEALRARDDAVLQRAERAAHPMVAAFIARQGVARLRSLDLHDQQHGGARRALLEREWNDHLEAFDGREVAALASARGTAGELRRLDPLASIGGAPRRQLESGSEVLTNPVPVGGPDHRRS